MAGIDTNCRPELHHHIYCYRCCFIGPIESFPFDFPDEEMKERMCPRCGSSDDQVNASRVPICGICNLAPAEKNDLVCSPCGNNLDAEIQNYEAKMRSE